MSFNTINKAEIEKFTKMADEWWDPYGKFKPLHKFNPIRIKYIKDNILKNLVSHKSKNSLQGIKILDIGCGGGLLSEPLCRLGAEVTGIDASSKNIDVAKVHAKKSNLDIEYICSSPEKLEVKDKFDVVLNMEIIEHVEDVTVFLNHSSNLLKKNGLMFVATLNKTLKSFAFAIVGAEYILRWLPIGTHEWNKFVKPSDLIKKASECSLNLLSLDGVKFNPLFDQWKLSEDKSINYISTFVKG